mmetsp:Transcript_10161/g.26373  ORF Transcript_10161/g.26373 Transcript_10161/m.26373 type:complete len:304 (-) Transcript_10161:334-1245(-)
MPCCGPCGRKDVSRRAHEETIQVDVSTLAGSLAPQHQIIPTGDDEFDSILIKRRVMALEKLPALRQRFPPEQYTEAQRHFLSDNTLIRHIEARDGDVSKAAAMLEGTLKWRSEHIDGVALSCPSCVANKDAHCFFPIGKDSRGWMVIYSCAARAIDKKPETSIVHMSTMLERIFEGNSTPGKIVWIIDMHGFGFADMDTTMARKSVPIFQDHYPERMGQIVILDPPAPFKALWEVVSELVDPVTKRKVKLLRKDKHEYFRRHCNEAQVAFLESVLRTEARPGSYPADELKRARAEAGAWSLAP